MLSSSARTSSLCLLAEDVLQALAKMPAETEPIVKPSLKLTHFWLYVKDTQRSIQFYRDILGFDVLQTFPDGALFKAGQYTIGNPPGRRRQKEPTGRNVNNTLHL